MNAMHERNVNRAFRIAAHIHGYLDSAPEGVKPADLNNIVDENSIRDVLADLMHLCEFCGPGTTFSDMVKLARQNYEHERNNQGRSPGDDEEEGHG